MLHPRIVELIEYLDLQRGVLVKAFETVPPSRTLTAAALAAARRSSWALISDTVR